MTEQEPVYVRVAIPRVEYPEIAKRAYASGARTVGEWLTSLAFQPWAIPETNRARLQRERREAVLIFWGRGLTNQQISQKLDETLQFVQMTVRNAGKTPHKKPTKG